MIVTPVFVAKYPLDSLSVTLDNVAVTLSLKL